MTENQLSSLQVNFFLQKLEKTYRNQKSKAFNYFLCGFIVPAVTSIFAMRFEDISQLSKSVFLVPFSISIGIAGCLALREYSKTPEKIQNLIDEENQYLVQKGLRWHLQKNSEIIELRTDYKFPVNKRALNDEEIEYKPTKDWRMYMTKSAINEEEEAFNFRKVYEKEPHVILF